MVPHPWRQGIQQSTNMLRNGSTLLKLEKSIRRVDENSQCPMDPMVAWETKDGEE
jgi:hypothetical protein